MRQRRDGARKLAQNPAQKAVQKAVERLAKREDADLYIYNAPILSANVDRLRRVVCAKSKKRPNAILFLTTFGGDPDAAFRLASCLRRHYPTFSGYLFGPCKSAGTLAVCGATITPGAVAPDVGRKAPVPPPSDEDYNALCA
jgi:ATP-dependent protease ClpP protease subunit